MREAQREKVVERKAQDRDGARTVDLSYALTVGGAARFSVCFCSIFTIQSEPSH